MKLGRGEKLAQEEGQAKRGYRTQSGLERERKLWGPKVRGEPSLFSSQALTRASFKRV